MNYKTISKLFCLAVAILALPQTAQADDTSMFTLGGASKKGGWPATVVFSLDTSGSMLFHNCEDCYSKSFTAKNAPNSSKICVSDTFQKLVGPDLNGDGVRDGYSPVYDRNNGTTWFGPHYKPLLAKDNYDNNNNTTYKSCSIWWTDSSYGDVPVLKNPSSCGRGTSNEKATFDNQIKEFCKAYSGCDTRNRCVFSLRTYGYFKESCTNTTGDPYGTCNCQPSKNNCGDKITEGVFTKDDQNVSVTGTKKSLVYLGDWMNFNPRRDHAVASALYSLIDELDDDIRVGYATYRDIPSVVKNTNTTNNTLHSTAKSGSQETKNVKPTCPTVNSTPACKDGEPDTACFQSYKTQFKDEIFDFLGTKSTGTPTAETMDHIGRFAAKAAGGDTSLFCDKCQNNAFMIVLTDGVPSGTCDTPGTKNCNTSTVRTCDKQTITTPVYKTETKETTTCVDRQFTLSVDCHADNLDLPEWSSNWCTITPSNWQTKADEYIEKNKCNTNTDRITFSDKNIRDQFSNIVKQSCKLKNDDVIWTYKCSDICQTIRTYKDNNEIETCSYFNCPQPKQKCTTTTTTVQTTEIDHYVTEEVEVNCRNESVTVCTQNKSGCLENTVDIMKKNHSGFTDGMAYTNGYLMDEVAYALKHADVMNQTDGIQHSVTTYTISFALTDINDPDKCPLILDQTAAAGGGKCIPAYDVSSLKEALTSIIKDVRSFPVSLTSASVAGVRGNGEDSVVSATFAPSKYMPFWESHVYKFQLCDEADPEMNCSCGGSADTEMCIVGRDNTLVTYEKGKLVTKPFWDGQLCLSGDYQNLHGVDELVEDPWNLDISNCWRYADETKSPHRKIYTVVAKDTDGVYNSNDDQIELLVNNASNFAKLKTAFGFTGNGAENDTRRLIKFLRGMDAYDLDHDGIEDEERSLSTMLDSTGAVASGWWKLGDFFHSSPQLIGGLTDSYSLPSYGNSEDRTEGFAKTIKDRRAIYVAGANDGMLHAFDAGTYNNDNLLVGDTGAELWAFIPPSLLPKFKDMCLVNTYSCIITDKAYFVDATPTFRDIYIGDIKDNLALESNADKWRTVLIGGLREGGKSYYALDVTDTSNPKFLWEFPPYLDATRNTWGIKRDFGETWLETGSSPSSIGALIVKSGTTASAQTGVKFVALLGGGYDRLDYEGRGYYLVDPYTGKLLYKAEYSASGNLNKMKYSFAAPPAFTLPIQTALTENSNMLAFSKIIAIDHAGQVWVQDLTNAVYSNDKLTNIPDPEVRFAPSSTLPNPGQYQTNPVFFLPITVKDNAGRFRGVFGTGDRDVVIPELEGNNWDTYVCNNPGYIYSVVLDANVCSSNRPCYQSDLQAINYNELQVGKKFSGTAQSKGWYVKLREGERVVNPPSLLSYRQSSGETSGMAVVTTFQPTLACDRGEELADTCGSEGSNGIGRLYLIDIQDGSLIADVQELQGEIPADPRMTTKVGSKVETAILLPGSNENPTPNVQRAYSYDDAVNPIGSFEVGHDLHNALHR